jgi:hypothetical protein
MKKLSVTIVLMGLVFVQCFAQDIKEHVSHSSWDALLNRHVTSEGKVNYDGFKSDVAKLDKYLKLIGDNEAKTGWSQVEKKAFWLNAYNAWTIKLVLERYPVNSIKDVSAKPWDKRFIKVGVNTHTLNDIENKIIRRQFKDARIHFAVNCAAISCPKLSNKAFTLLNVEKELDRLTKEFFKSENVKLVEKSAQLSKIFEWYAEDFIQESESVLNFVEQYSGMTFHPKVKVSYLDYNWKLNKQ